MREVRTCPRPPNVVGHTVKVLWVEGAGEIVVSLCSISIGFLYLNRERATPLCR